MVLLAWLLTSPPTQTPFLDAQDGGRRPDGPGEGLSEGSGNGSCVMLQGRCRFEGEGSVPESQDGHAGGIGRHSFARSP
jgi:hypothetical protein